MFLRKKKINAHKKIHFSVLHDPLRFAIPLNKLNQTKDQNI